MWARAAGWRGWRGWWRARAGGSRPAERRVLLRVYAGALEAARSWESPGLSLAVLALAHLLFLIFVHLNVGLFELVFIIGAFVTCLDAIEAYLRYKHRAAFLQRLSNADGTNLYQELLTVQRWVNHHKEEYLALRKSNPTKAFLQMTIMFGAVFLVGKVMSGTMLLYILTMTVMLQPVFSPYMVRFVKKIRQVAESDGEIDSLLPELSEQNLKDLNFEGEIAADARHNTDYWLPDEALPTSGDLSESSDDDSNSSTTALLAVKNGRNDKDINMETSDSSDDEYLPESVQEKDNFISTLEILPPESSTWSASAVGALWSISSTLSGLVNASAPQVKSESKRKQISSADSTDGFEFIDKSDLL